MAARKPRIVIVGAGVAGLTAANKLFTCPGSKDLFELCVVEAGNRIGGRIRSTEFGGAKIEMGATWIHGTGGSPIHRIAVESGSLHSDRPWECMDGFSDKMVTVAEGGFELKPLIVNPVNALFDHLMEFARRKKLVGAGLAKYQRIASDAIRKCEEMGSVDIGSFLREGLRSFWDTKNAETDNADTRILEEAIFGIQENIQRTYTSASDLRKLNYETESEYEMFPDEEITIANGYISVLHSIASVLPSGTIQLGKKVSRIKWTREKDRRSSRPVKIDFSDGSVLSADHVIVTVSLGVLKSGIREEQDTGLFDPPLPEFKTRAISRLGYGLVNKLFVEVSDKYDEKNDNECFPYLRLAFHRPDSKLRIPDIPWWMRRTATVFPIYKNSNVLLIWFAGKEALALESLTDEEISSGLSTTISSFLNGTKPLKTCNGNLKNSGGRRFETEKILRSDWGTDPLFLGSYSYVAVGSTGEDLDTLAAPLPPDTDGLAGACPPALQILFAGEATHRTHYSTTHGAYLSGLREACRLLQFHKWSTNGGLQS